jgi:hypothetical protein
MINLSRIIIPLCSLVLLTGSFSVSAIEPQRRELQWAYIMNFVHFIRWPNSNIDPVVRVCVVGKSPFVSAQDEVKLNKRTGSITVTLEYEKLPEIDVLKRCDMIYFSQHISLAQLSFIFSKLNKLPIVTIGDHRGFNKVGGLLQFTEHDKKLGFRLNKTLLHVMKLKIHPSLLRLSDKQ